MNRDYNGVVKRKARRWWIVGGAGILLVLLAAGYRFIAYPGAPFRFLTDAEFSGLHLGEYDPPSPSLPRPPTVIRYTVNGQFKDVLLAAQAELNYDHGWTWGPMHDDYASFSRDKTSVTLLQSRQSPGIVDVSIERPAAWTDNWLAKMPWYRP